MYTKGVYHLTKLDTYYIVLYKGDSKFMVSRDVNYDPTRIRIKTYDLQKKMLNSGRIDQDIFTCSKVMSMEKMT